MTLWCPRQHRVFFNNKHYAREHVREHAQICMPITRSTDGESLAVLVSNLINQFGLGSKIFSITSDSGTNLARCKAILENIFDNTGVFDLGKTMFVMEGLSHVKHSRVVKNIL